jgi:hypothetical protein
MATLYVLDAPEFAPLVQAALVEGLAVAKRADYYVLSREGEIRISRKATGLRRSIWFGALTGGFEGRLGRFDDDELTIT